MPAVQVALRPAGPARRAAGRSRPPASRPARLLLDGRTAPPRLPPDYVARPRLREALDGAVPLGAALVVAPGGFGKTVALADFAAHAPFPVAWLSLSPAEADLVAFIEALGAAVRRVVPRFGRTAAALARQAGGAAPDALARELTEGLGLHGQPIGLVLDDFHHLDGAADVTRTVSALLERMPPSVFVAVASRTLPSLPHARLLAAGRLRQLVTDDLRFDSAEVAAYVDGRADPRGALEASAGWATALVLGQRVGADLGALEEYLRTEVWGSQPLEMRKLL